MHGAPQCRINLENRKALSYERKITLMMEPLDFPVSRLMTTRQATDYLEGIHRHFSEQGISLTDPGDLLRNYNSPEAQSTTTGNSPTQSVGPRAEAGSMEHREPASASNAGRE